MLKPRLEILPPSQRRLWDEMRGAIPAGFVLYGGTALALRLGHRASEDFDFFSNQRASCRLAWTRCGNASRRQRRRWISRGCRS